MEKRKGKVGFVVWSAVSSFVAILLVVVTIVTHLADFYPAICIVLGRERPKFASGVEPIYTTEYKNKKEVQAAANALNEKVVEEGIVLLKNEVKNGQSTLPLYTPESPEGKKTSAKPKISVFGQNSIDLALGGSGSGGATSKDGVVDLYTALGNAGYDVNPELKKFYEKSGYKRTKNSGDLDSGDSVYLSTGEAPQSAYGSVKKSYANYNDAAIVVFTRIGGEGFDLPRTMKGQAGARKDDDHYLQLDRNETDLLQAVCESDANFKKIIVVINSAAAMELAFLEDSDYYAYNSKIDAALWIGFPGASGTAALGRILNGSVNPSGRTVDTYVKDLKQDPTWANFGDNRVAGGDAYKEGGEDSLYYFVDYEESIYVGYRYYETRGVGNESWYDNAVVYPFGYGKSYTTFNWTVEDKSSIENVTISKDGKYEIKVKVTNTGDVAGKDVVQLYGHAPYKEGGIEKSEVVLLDFAKTKEIQPGGEDFDVVTLNFDPYYLASYDYKDANGNGYKGYELDASADYALYVSKNAHDKTFTIPFTSGNIRYEYSTVNPDVKVENLYTDCEDKYFNSDMQLGTVLSRNGWNMPQTRTADEMVMDDALLTAFKDKGHNNPHADEYAEAELPWFGNPVTYKLRDLLDENNVVHYTDERWEEILNACTEEELIALYDNGAFKSNSILSIGKNLTNDTDGPAGFTNFMSKDGTYWGTCNYCAEVVMAATWNEELMEELGEMVGSEGIIGADGKGNGLSYSGWYAPGVNIHRSAFGGRNFEYFSEDGILNGKMAAAEIRGCRSKGVYCFVKHFALNEQETHRSITGLITWATEQSMREIYLKPFELAVKEGGANAIMSSFNRIGTRWTGGDYRLLTQILRNEWDFKGMVLCDFNTIPQYMDSKQMAYAGGDLNLATQPVSWCDTSDIADLIVLRNAAKNVFYTVANSNAMNYDIVGYAMPSWEVALIVVDCLVPVALAIWGFFAIWKFVKGESFFKRFRKNQQESVEHTDTQSE